MNTCASKQEALDYATPTGTSLSRLIFKVALPTCLICALLGWAFYPRFAPRHNGRIVDTLTSPVPITGWNNTALVAADGALIPLPDVTSLDPQSPLLAQAMLRGVEVSGGRIFGLVEIDHWCGTDPIGYHLARVDLQYALLLTGQAQPTPAIAGAWSEFRPPNQPTEDQLDPGAWDILRQMPSLLRNFPSRVSPPPQTPSK